MTAAPRFQLITLDSPASTFADDVRRGLGASPKSLPPRWFYDSVGSALFDAICNLPEYYVTRAETKILTTNAAAIAKAFGTPARIVELGSGTARKTRLLLDQLEDIEYVPVDVDAETLSRTGRDLLGEYPSIRITAVCSDFMQPSRPMNALPPVSGRTIVLFLGSTIGNLDPGPARAMLRDLRASLQEEDSLFLGADLRKSRAVLEAAYDDALGVTAAFNRNVLQRINRELGGQFDLSAFTHRAFYDEILGRIEMHLVSTREQRVFIAAIEETIAFAKDETIHTESSHKYDRATLEALASDSGFAIEAWWSDVEERFADLLLVAKR
ncbi:MAG TPA: L-histidine N(alpha)-methyltransferase [Thermoanaerobaculia bacterium]|jgi:L-histidine N-alpha-methyltransferase